MERSARWFPLPHRGVIEVTGGDRDVWLNGMVSNVMPAGDGCCHAALLTPKGRIVADLYVVRAGEQRWLELERAAVPRIIAHLERHVIADDVALADRSDALLRISVEGAAATDRLSGGTAPPEAVGDPAAAAGAVWSTSISGKPATLASYGFGGEPALQIFAPGEARDGLEAALEALGIARGEPDELEIRRIEAGIPRLGRELDEDVLPDEARLDDAISTTKGCYTGQEIVARLRSRGQVQHLLVGLRFAETGLALEPEASPPTEFAIEVDGRRSGELTSACVSLAFGPIALGFVRREHAEAGRRVELVAGERRVAAEVVLLPFSRSPSEAARTAQ